MNKSVNMTKDEAAKRFVEQAKEGLRGMREAQTLLREIRAEGRLNEQELKRALSALRYGGELDLEQFLAAESDEELMNCVLKLVGA